MMLNGYDAWKTGGDSHRSHVEVYCENEECEAHGEIVETTVLVEYGRYEAPECVLCYGTMGEA